MAHGESEPVGAIEQGRGKEFWYADGLRFRCTRCGNCCTGAPGFVWVDEPEIRRLAESLGMTEASFGKRYLRQVGDRISLVEKRGGDCIFWDQRVGCTVYEARPVQCRTWPFWAENVGTPEMWERTRAKCPGSGKGRLYTVEQIERAVKRTPE